MNYQHYVKELLEYSNEDENKFRGIIKFIKKKKTFTPAEVAAAGNIGYARAVRIIDLLCELGYTDFHGYTTPTRKVITLLEKKRRPKKNVLDELHLLKDL